VFLALVIHYLFSLRQTLNIEPMQPLFCCIAVVKYQLKTECFWKAYYHLFKNLNKWPLCHAHVSQSTFMKVTTAELRLRSDGWFHQILWICINWLRHWDRGEKTYTHVLLRKESGSKRMKSSLTRNSLSCSHNVVLCLRSAVKNVNSLQNLRISYADHVWNVIMIISALTLVLHVNSLGRCYLLFMVEI